MIEMYNQDHPKLARNALPIKNPDVISFIKQTDSQNFFSNALQDADLREKFLTEYFKWINKSTLNQLKGLKILKTCLLCMVLHKHLIFSTQKIITDDFVVLKVILSITR